MHGRVVLCLNKDQHQGVLYRQHLGSLPAGIEIVAGFGSIGDLLAAIARFDYGVFTDSGPAHMSQLFATSAVAPYTSAPGEVLPAMSRNLAKWTVTFVSPHCPAAYSPAEPLHTPKSR